MFEGEYNTRIFDFKKGNVNFITPNYIPSFSSREDHYLKERINALLDEIPQQVILISAYDYYNLKRAGHITTKFIEKSFKEKLLFLDSGGYELQFSDGDDWTPLKYKQTIEEMHPAFFVEYDRIPSYKKPSDTNSLIYESIEFLKDYSTNGRVLLMHFSLMNNPQKEIQSFVKTLQKFSDYFDILGIPEREMGANIIQRTQFIYYLRKELDKEEILKPIHIFGCSDPISLILLTLSGADIFDGLGWIKDAFDVENLRTMEGSQLPFFNCDCIACKNMNWQNISAEEYEYRLLIHNLYAYDNFFFDFRKAIISNEITEFIEKIKLNSSFGKVLEEILS